MHKARCQQPASGPLRTVAIVSVFPFSVVWLLLLLLCPGRACVICVVFLLGSLYLAWSGLKGRAGQGKANRRRRWPMRPLSCQACPVAVLRCSQPQPHSDLRINPLSATLLLHSRPAHHLLSRPSPRLSHGPELCCVVHSQPAAVVGALASCRRGFVISREVTGSPRPSRRRHHSTPSPVALSSCSRAFLDEVTASRLCNLLLARTTTPRCPEASHAHPRRSSASGPGQH